MSDILSDYTAIFAATKEWDRKERHRRIQLWANTEHSIPLYDEVMSYLAFAEAQRNIKISIPFWRKVVFPAFDQEIFENHNIEPMKYILRNRMANAFLEFKNDYSLDLLELALKYGPDDYELLTLKWEYGKNYFPYTIHEVPSGVLYGSNGASIEQTKILLSDLDEYEAICNKLGHDDSKLIGECRFYYRKWIEYLSDREANKCFAEMLDGA